jgi:hypothetical protein
MTDQPIEYYFFNGSSAKVIMNKCGVNLAAVKTKALEMHREGLISEEDAQKYYQAKEPATRAAKTESRRGRPAKAEAEEVTEADAVKPKKARAKKPAEKKKARSGVRARTRAKELPEE